MYMYIRQRPFFKRSIKLAVPNNASLHTDDYEKNQCTYIYLNDRNLPNRNALSSKPAFCSQMDSQYFDFEII